MKYVGVFLTAFVATAISLYATSGAKMADHPPKYSNPHAFHWADYPEYPRKPEPGTAAFNEVRYLRRYQGYRLAERVLKTEYILDYILEHNPDIKRPCKEEIDKFLATEVEWFTRMGDDDPENPRNDPDDE